MVLPNSNSLKIHTRMCQTQSGSSVQIHQCDVCSAQYSCKRSRDRHVRINHPGTARPEFHHCPTCPSRYQHAGHLERHIRCKHHAPATSDGPQPNFQRCPSCPSRFLRAANLDRHVLAKHQGTTTTNGTDLYQCTMCSLRFTKKATKDRHVRNKHPTAPTSIRRVRYRCRLCEWPGSSLMSVRRHTRQVHTIHRTGRARCMHPGCPFASKTVTELRQHLVSVHEEACDIINMHFVNLAAFFHWRREHEHSRDVRFNVQSRRAGAFNMICHRSGGKAVCGGRDGRSVRTGRLCTASMRVRLTDEDPALPVRVQACLHHHGHDSQRKHLRLSAVDRNAIAGAVFMLLVEGHHDSEISSARNAYVRLLCGTTAYEIMDSVQFVSLLIISESHVISSIFIERVILALSAVNFFLPTISLYKLSLSDCGLDKGSPFVVMMYKLLHLLFINLPYMSIRLYLWSALGGDISLFLMKNILGVITTVYSVYPELLLFRAQGRCCSRTPDACSQQPDTSGLEMDDPAAVSLRDAAGRTSHRTLSRAPPDETDSPALWLQHSFC